MSKRILVLEPSQTMRALLKEGLEGEDCSLDFAANGFSFLWALCKEPHTALFVNAKAQNPQSLELVRLVKSAGQFRTVPVALYAAGDFAFEGFYAKNSGADAFVRISSDRVEEGIRELAAVAGRKARAVPVSHDGMKGAITQELLAMTGDISSLPRLVQGCLKLVTEFCEVPAVSLFFLDDAEPSEYYLCAATLSEGDERDFLKVCAADFEQEHPDVNISKIVPRRLAAGGRLDAFRTNDVPLSSYQSVPLIGADMRAFGAIHVVKEGNFSAEQLDLLFFCSKYISLVLGNAVLIKKKNAFERDIRKAFSRFVPEQIIDELVSSAGTDGDVAVGEKREVAILFSDIRSFTNISERNKPETIVAFLNRYFTIMVNIIKKHGGTIDKFIGDAIMALFGAPVSYEDNARRAVAAAYEMREALPSVPLEDLVLPEGMDFNIGIGIHYGDVIVGSIGSADKTDYSVIGDNVNLASRLEGLTKTYGAMIVVSGSVKADIGDDAFVFRYLDDVKVKGKAQSVPIYAVDRAQDEFSPAYRDSYTKGMDLYRRGIWNLAKEYFGRALAVSPGDKAAGLMLERCDEFIANPPENWDGAISFHTK